jgi:monoamine oxidase
MAKRKEQISNKYTKNRKSVQYRNSIISINEQIKDAKQLLARKEYVEGNAKAIEREDLEDGVRKLQELKAEIKDSAKDAEVQNVRESIDALLKAFKPDLIKKIATSYKASTIQNSRAGIEALKKSLNSTD